MKSVNEDATDNDKIICVDAGNHSDILCKNYILNGLTNTLYTVYSEKKDNQATMRDFR